MKEFIILVFGLGSPSTLNTFLYFYKLNLKTQYLYTNQYIFIRFYFILKITLTLIKSLKCFWFFNTLLDYQYLWYILRESKHLDLVTLLSIIFIFSVNTLLFTFLTSNFGEPLNLSGYLVILFLINTYRKSFFLAVLFLILFSNYEFRTPRKVYLCIGIFFLTNFIRATNQLVTEGLNKRKIDLYEEESLFLLFFVFCLIFYKGVTYFSDDNMDTDSISKSNNSNINGENDNSALTHIISSGNSIVSNKSKVNNSNPSISDKVVDSSLVSTQKSLKEQIFQSNSSLVSNDHITSIPAWKELIKDQIKARKFLYNIWMGRNLTRTAKFILQKQSSSIDIVKSLYDRLIYLYNSHPEFPKEEINVRDNDIDSIKDKDDLDWINELELEIDKNINYILFEGKKYLLLDEFGILLFSIINPKDISKDFPIRNLGAGRFIVGFSNVPSMEALNKKMSEFSISSISYQKMLDSINANNDKTGGAIFFLNGKVVSYSEVQSAIANLKNELKSLIKRVYIKKDMIILFIPLNKLSFFLEQVKYLEVNKFIFKSLYNLAPEYHDDIGKIIAENCPLNKPTLLKGFIERFCDIDPDNIINIVQVRKPNVKGNGKRNYAYLVWIRSQKAIRRLLLSVIDLYKEPNRLGFFNWPKTKGEELNPINSSLII